MQTSEIRKRYLDFFIKKGHLEIPSSSLISPDPSTLFTIAGMVPLIPYFTGLQTPPSNKLVSVQKCVRTLDIDEVGKTTRHGTFFQMNGNFGIGSYFKKEAIEYSWEFITGSKDDGNLGIDKDVIWITIHENDDEAYKYWKEIAKLPDERIQRRDNKDNFWSTGQAGPGGECSEIYVDRGPSHGKEGGPIVDEDRYVEIWNLVFQHFLIDNVKSKTEFDIVGELPSKNIDTGMGLERVATVMQGKDNMYEIDEVYPVINAMCELAKLKYGESNENDIQLRILADHIRSSVMIISDGVKPSNEGRGYVLRRLLRRCIRASRLLDFNDPIIEILFNASIDVMSKSYPELLENKDRILNIGLNEEQAFRKTLKEGIQFFNTAVSKLSSKTIDGKTAFNLHDTHGFPFELTKEMASEKGLKIDETKFLDLMQEQKERARNDAREKKGLNVDNSFYNNLLKDLKEPNKFIGYKELSQDNKIVAIINSEGSQSTVSGKGEIEIIMENSPFYFESGGQQADFGTITSKDGVVLDVYDVQAPLQGLIVHKCKMFNGTLKVGDPVHIEVDKIRRNAICKSHSSTHMIHKALRDLLGESSTQAGSLDAPNRLRFDIHNSSKISDEIISEAEHKVNEMLIKNLSVEDEIMPLDQAKKSGAMALFGEKYTDLVRVVSIGDDWSKELCVGTHVGQTGEIGSISIISESAIGSGIRRVDALVGMESFNYNNKEKVLLSQLTNIAAAPKDQLLTKVESIVNKLSETEKKLANLQKSQLSLQIPSLLQNGKVINNIKFIFTSLDNIEDQKAVQQFGQDILNQAGSNSLVVIYNPGEEKSVTSIFAGSKTVENGINANDIPKILQPVIQGGGGGRPNFATCGGSKTGKQLGELVIFEIEKYLQSK